MPHEFQNALASRISVAAKHFVRECTVRVYRVIGYEARDAGAGATEEVVLHAHAPAPSDLY
ncbi:hypothetical protein D3C85_1476510 [compost metagenome]